MIEINKIATNLECREPGIWFSKNRSHVSYPGDGNLRSLAIEDNSFWFNHRNKCILEAIRRVPPDGAIFDMGAGNGYVSLMINNAGMDTVVIEPGLQGAMNAHARGLSPVICSTLEDAGFKPHLIPAVGLFDVLEHVQDNMSYLTTLKTLLRPSGKLYITVPAYNFLWSAEDDHAGHYRRYTNSSLAKLLHSIGFIIDYKTYIFSILPLPIFLFRAIPSRLGLRKSNTFERTQKEHGRIMGPFGHLVNWMLHNEIKALRHQRAIAFGGSCLVVARAP
jgi:SAM-dependent methyltransferase